MNPPSAFYATHPTPATPADQEELAQPPPPCSSSSGTTKSKSPQITAAYNLFFQHERQLALNAVSDAQDRSTKLLQKHGGSLTKLSTDIAAKWKALSESERSLYASLASRKVPRRRRKSKKNKISEDINASTNNNEDYSIKHDTAPAVQCTSSRTGRSGQKEECEVFGSQTKFHVANFGSFALHDEEQERQQQQQVLPEIAVPTVIMSSGSASSTRTKEQLSPLFSSSLPPLSSALMTNAVVADIPLSSTFGGPPSLVLPKSSGSSVVSTDPHSHVEDHRHHNDVPATAADIILFGGLLETSSPPATDDNTKEHQRPYLQESCKPPRQQTLSGLSSSSPNLLDQDCLQDLSTCMGPECRAMFVEMFGGIRS